MADGTPTFSLLQLRTGEVIIYVDFHKTNLITLEKTLKLI